MECNVRWQVLSGVSAVRDFLLQMEPDNCIEALPCQYKAAGWAGECNGVN